MGAWGMRAFDNDAVLDEIAELTDRDRAMVAIEYVLAPPEGAWDSDRASDVAFGAAEVIAAARMGTAGYQSEGTTLFASLAGAREEVEPYLPEEVGEFISGGAAVFSDDDARSALRALDAIEANDARRGWRDPVERAEAIAQTRERLMHALIG